MNTFTYALTKTRLESIAEQVAMFLQFSGLAEEHRSKLVLGVESQWLTKVGVFLERGGKRILEAEVSVDWELHTKLAKITPIVRTDFPGWEQGVSPEIKVIGQRFGEKARVLGISPRGWVVFTSEIYKDPVKYRERCKSVGVQCGVGLPDWESSPVGRSYSVEYLQEVKATIKTMG